MRRLWGSYNGVIEAERQPYLGIGAGADGGDA